MQGICRVVLPGLVLALAVSACGSSDGSGDPVAASDSPSSAAAGPSESPAGTPTPTDDAPDPSPTAEVPAKAPDCSGVWRDGARLPRTYAGCVDDGAYVRRDVLECSSGQRLVRFDDAWYGVLGGEVQQATPPLVDDAGYRRTVVACRA